MTTQSLLPLLLLAAALNLQAEKRALIIAIGTYSTPELHKLDGPPNDAKALADLLTQKLGFTDVRTLVGPQATHAAIVAALNALKARTRKGDYIVFYYSGHGTSAYESANNVWGLDPNTGALLPYDVQPGADPTKVNEQLIIGKRDLRPAFTEIDNRDATLLAIFDTCYSADAAKSVARGAPSRYIPLSSLTATPATGSKGLPGQTNTRSGHNDMDAADPATMLAHQEVSPFPYRNVISLAATGKVQPAADMTSDDIRFDPSLSYDGLPHGYFTESLLRGMVKGEADKNHDGKITHEELYNYLQERSVHWAKSGSQHPVLQVAADQRDALLSKPAFESAAAVPRDDRGTVPKGVAIVRTESIPATLADRISKLPGIRLAPATGAIDLLVKPAPKPGQYDLYDGALTAISTESLSEDALVHRIAAQPQVLDLIDLRYSQKFNVTLQMEPGDQIVFDNVTLTFSAKTEQSAWLMLLNVDVSGAVTVVYPRRPPSVPVEAGSFQPLGNGRAEWPFGVEYIKLFAFSNKPADYDQWYPLPGEDYRTVEPGTPEFDRLMKMLQSEREGRAETRLRVVSAKRNGGKN